MAKLKISKKVLAIAGGVLGAVLVAGAIVATVMYIRSTKA